MDETTSLHHPCLESLEMDERSVYKLAANIQRSGNVLGKKYFSRIKTLQLSDTLCDPLSWEHGWYMMLLASQSLTTFDLRDHFESKFSRLDLGSHLRCTHSGVVLGYSTNFGNAFEVLPCNLGQFPSLRHFKTQVRGDFRTVAVLRFLKTLLSKPSSSSIESLEIKFNFRHGGENDLFSSEAGWPELDEILTCENFVCLKKITLSLDVCMKGMVKDGDNYYKKQLELEKNLTTLLPMFRASNSRRTLETCLVVYEGDDDDEGS